MFQVQQNIGADPGAFDKITVAITGCGLLGCGEDDSVEIKPCIDFAHNVVLILGVNENTNSLIRQYFTNSTDFKSIPVRRETYTIWGVLQRYFTETTGQRASNIIY